MTNDRKKTAIVTGGSRGLGSAVAADLAAAGWQVIVNGRDGDALKEVAGQTGIAAIRGDIRDPAHRAELVDAADRLHGGLDLVVNNASTLGASPLPPIGRYPLARLQETFEVNVVAAVGLIQLALPLLRAGGGAIINVTSDAATEAYPGWGGYGSSKAALEHVSRVLAAEEPELRVWWFDPGDMRTRMHQEAFPGEDISDRPEPATVSPAVLRLLDLRPPSGRIRAADLRRGALG